MSAMSYVIWLGSSSQAGSAIAAPTRPPAALTETDLGPGALPLVHVLALGLSRSPLGGLKRQKARWWRACVSVVDLHLRFGCGGRI
jgi:hypothetical protein